MGKQLSLVIQTKKNLSKIGANLPPAAELLQLEIT